MNKFAIHQETRKKSKLHCDLSKDMRESKTFQSASRKSSSSHVSSDEHQSCSSDDTSNHSSKSRFTEESTYSRRSPSKSDSDSESSSNDSVTILSPVKNISKKVRKARSRSRYRKHEKSYDKLKHISHEKPKKSRKRRGRKRSVSSISSDSASHSTYYKSQRPYLSNKKSGKVLSNSYQSTPESSKHEKSYDKLKHIPHEKQKKSRKRRCRKRSVSSISSDSASHSKCYKSQRPYLSHKQSGKVLSNSYQRSPESSNHTVGSHDRLISRKLSSRPIYYKSQSISVCTDGRVKNCQGGNDLRDKNNFWKLSNSKLTNDIRGRRHEVNNSSKGKFQGCYYGAGVEEDTNYELNKYSSGKIQERYFETGDEGYENESNKNPSGKFEGRFYETGNERDRKNGDWYCGKCGNLNFRFRIWCNRCDVAKQESQRKNDEWVIPEEGKMHCYNGMDFCLKVSQDLGGLVKNCQGKEKEELKLHWGKSVKKDDYKKNYVGGKYRCDICDVTVANQHQIQIHMDGSSHKKKCGEVDSFYCDLCMVAVTCQETLDSHRKGKNHLKRVKQEEDRKKLHIDEQRYITTENGKPTAKEKQELDLLKAEIRTLQRTVKNLEELNQHCKSNHSSAEYQELLKYKTRCKDRHVRSKIQLKKSFKELKNESFADGDVKNQERKEGIAIANFKGKIEKSRDSDNDYSPPILTGGLKKN